MTPVFPSPDPPSSDYAEVERRLHFAVEWSAPKIAFWRRLYYFFRLSVITLSAVLTAFAAAGAKNVLTASLATIVAVITGADTVIKPGEHWSAHQQFVSEVWNLQASLRLERNNPAVIKRLNKRYEAAQRKLHTAGIPLRREIPHD